MREALGGTYGVQVEAHASKIPEARYSVTIDFGCDPGRTEELVKALFREIDALKSNGPTSKDVDDARVALVREHESDLAVRTAGWCGALADAYENSEDVSVFFGLPAQYASLTAVVDPGRGASLPRHGQLRAGDTAAGEGGSGEVAGGRALPILARPGARR